MQESIVYLIRHGEVDNPSGLHYGRFRDIGLIEKGFQQLEFLGKMLEKRGEKPVAIYVSPLRRAQESANSMFKDVEKTTLDDLNETDSHGLEGMTIAEERSVIDKETPPEEMWTENPNEVAGRMIHAITRARTDHPGEVVALISHGDPIAYATYRLLNKEGPLPPHQELAKTVFPEKGSGFRFVLDKEGNVLSHEPVGVGSS